MTTSETFRKLPTEWLDVNDTSLGLGNPSEAPDFCPFVKRELTIDLDTVAVVGSNESTTHSEGSLDKNSRRPPFPLQNRSFFEPSFRKANMTERKDQEAGLKPHSADCGVSKVWFTRLTYQHIGSARYIGDLALLFFRVVFFFIFAISGGTVFGHRHEIDLIAIHSELFLWLHYWFFILYPFLLWSSLLNLRTLNPDAIDPRRIWTFTSALSHILTTFAQVELFRLLLLNLVHQLQPSYTSGTSIYSLSSSFAGQRYIMFVASLVEFYFSTNPCLIEYVFVTVFLSAAWETGSVFTKDIEPIWVKIVFSIGVFSLASMLAIINLLIANRLPSNRKLPSLE
ncbi:unnamed protein product [Agarophyton chilense]